MAIFPVKKELKIKIWGERLWSEKRVPKLFIETEPKIGLQEFIDVCRMTESVLKTYYDDFPQPSAWWKHRVCPKCKEAFVMHKKKLGFVDDPLHYHCLRHGVIDWLWDLEVINNKPRYIRITRSGISVYICSNRHEAAIFWCDKVATIFFDKKFIWTYKKHYDSYPYLSSHAAIAEWLEHCVGVVRSVLCNPQLFGEGVIYFNGEVVGNESESS